MISLYQKLTARLRRDRGRAAEREQIAVAPPSLDWANFLDASFSTTSHFIRQLPASGAFCAWCGGKLPSAAAVKCQNCGGPVERESPRPELRVRAPLGPGVPVQLPRSGELPAGLSPYMVALGAVLGILMGTRR